MSRPGRLIWWPAYRAPVKPAKGLLAVPEAMLVGTAGGVEVDDAEAGWVWLLAALLTMWMVLLCLIL